MRLVARLSCKLVLAAAALLLVACLAVVTTGLVDDPHAADLAVVLGSKVNLDGTSSEMLKARLITPFRFTERGISN